MDVALDWISENPSRFILYIGILSWMSLSGVLPDYREYGFLSKGARAVFSAAIAMFGSSYLLDRFFDLEFEMSSGISLILAAASVYVQRPWRW